MKKVKISNMFKNSKINVMLSLCALAVCMFLTSGCAIGSYLAYEIDSPLTEANLHEDLYYIADIRGAFITAEQIEQIKADLSLKHPDVFTNDPTKGVPVRFFWIVNYSFDNYSSGWFFLKIMLSAFSYNIIPCITTVEHTGVLTAWVTDNRGATGKAEFKYPIKVTELMHVNPLTAWIFDGFWYLILPADIKSDFIEKTNERLAMPYNSHPHNWDLFIAVCNRAMTDAKSKEVRNPENINRKRVKSIDAKRLKQMKAQLNEQQAKLNEMQKPAEPAGNVDFSVPSVPADLIPGPPRPKAKLYGKWKAKIFAKIRTVVPSAKYDRIIASTQEFIYTFMENGKVKIEILANGKNSMSLASYSYNGGVLTLRSKGTDGQQIPMQYNLFWFEDTKMEIRLLNAKDQEKLMNDAVGSTGNKMTYSIDEKGVTKTVMTLPNGTATILMSPMIFDKVEE
ncbi:MAG: hypothetical protein IKB16_05915 [Lentisphaeria bacterium]|nr:hypothetical protein [Lentisphaeria bacterium]